MLARQIGMVAVAFVVTAGSVMAQNDGPRGDRPGRGGPGGRGGGFGRMGGAPDSYLGLLRMEEVQAELKITDDQKTKVREIGEEVRNAARPEGLDRESLRDASREERQAAMAKMRELAETREKDVRAKLATVLDETQLKRLRGLWVQRMGAVAALNNADIAAELKLTDEQKATLTKQQDEQRESMRGNFGRRGEGGPPPGEGAGGGNFFERMQEQRKAADDKALGVLSEEQKASYAAIEGDKFTFPPPQRGEGRGGFGGGRGRGEGGERPNRPNRPARDSE